MLYRSLLLLLLLPAFLVADPTSEGESKALKAMQTLKTPGNFKISLFAADPQLASGVAFCVDDKGRIYVAEEYRFNQGTEENRTRPFFLDDDLQIQTLDDRLKMYQKFANKFEGGMDWFSKHADQVRLVEDRDGDGRADHSTIFAGGFNDPLDGLAAGVMADERGVYFTCIPNLWLLKDKDGDGKAEERISLHKGFGVNCAFLGHDLHGLTWGPDGKLYFSVGDRGFHVVTKEGKTLHGPRMGGVFRCDPDGANLELVMRGLRNPQELAFDQYGNLFADDNNCDKGDHARLVYVVEGGEVGWNMAYQTIPDPYLTGPWHAERMWHLPNATPGVDPKMYQPAWIVPCVGKIGTGPSGFTFSSGVGWGERYKNRFFMANYTGNGGIESFGVKPKGAGFEITDYHDFLKPIMATDVEFGYDGKMYVLDFVNLLWNGGSAGGRIYTVSDPEGIKDSHVAETKKLFAKGFKQRSNDELVKLLAHPDYRVRQRAQFALAERGTKSLDALTNVAKNDPNQFARIHAIWGLAQIARLNVKSLDGIVPLLQDADAEIRAQVAKILGDLRHTASGDKLVSLLIDQSPRVKFFAAQSLGKLQFKTAVLPLLTMIEKNNDEDPYLRSVAVIALENINDRETVQSQAKNPSAAIRLAILLTQRRWNDERIAQFLEAPELHIVTEAARAIHDLGIEKATPALLKVLPRFIATPGAELDPLIRRALDAHLRNGTIEDARLVAQAVTVPHFSPAVRAEAIAILRDWTNPGPRDRVTGFWRPVPKHDPAIVRQVVEESLTNLLSKTTGTLQSDVVNLIGQVNAKVDETQFINWIKDDAKSVRLRGASLRLLAARKSPKLNDMLDTALKSQVPQLRSEARDILSTIDPKHALTEISAVLADDKADLGERQQCFTTLSRMKDDAAGQILNAWGDKLIGGQVPIELRIDVLESLKVLPGSPRAAIAKKFEDAVPRNNPMARYSISLTGGNAERGRDLFVGHTTGQCIRCHAINGQGGVAGPELSKLVMRNPDKTREHILESLMLPNAKIAQGFANVVLNLLDGKVVAGTVQAEDADTITVQTPDNRKVVVKKSNIEERTVAPSAMPTMDRALTPYEVRDLIEYLMTLK